MSRRRAFTGGSVTTKSGSDTRENQRGGRKSRENAGDQNPRVDLHYEKQYGGNSTHSCPTLSKTDAPGMTGGTQRQKCWKVDDRLAASGTLQVRYRNIHSFRNDGERLPPDFFHRAACVEDEAGGEIHDATCIGGVHGGHVKNDGIAIAERLTKLPSFLVRIQADGDNGGLIARLAVATVGTPVAALLLVILSAAGGAVILVLLPSRT